MTHDTDRQRQQWTRRGVIGSAAAAAVATVPATTVAETDARGGLFADATLSERAIASSAFVGGMLDAVRANTAATLLGTRSARIDDYVDGAIGEFEAHDEAWVEYVNNRDLGGSDRQSLRITFEYRGDERVRYLIADYDDNAAEYIDISVETDGPDDPDHTATVSDDAVANAEDELKIIHEEYIVPDEDIDDSHASYLAGRYYFSPNDHVTSSLLGGGS